MNIKPVYILVSTAEAIFLQANSTRVHSSQARLHPRLASVVLRHLRSEHHAPIATHNLQAYALLRDRLRASARPLVLDSFCGTGHSTRALAARHPDHLVVGIDQSAHRLGKHPCDPGDDYLLLRAQCEAIWTLLARDGLFTDFHYLLYPNPWPKPGHLGRRVHGHPGFAQLLRLGGRLELRSNWQIYVEEFGTAMHLAGQRGVVSRLRVQGEGLSLFERKYRDSGHALWRYTAPAVTGSGE